MISAGHSWTEIQNYTVEQIELFAHSIMKLSNHETCKNAWTVHVASQGGHKDMMKFISMFKDIKAGNAEELMKDYGK